MTGPEHYAEAQKLAEMSRSHSISDGSAAFTLALAQVHATLALAAATVLAAAASDITPFPGMTRATRIAWSEAIL